MNSLFKWSKKIMPTISKTERIALQSGTVGIDRLIFSGSMRAKNLDKYKETKITKIDKSMLEKIPLLKDCIKEDEIIRNTFMDISHPFWEVSKENKFFSLIFPEKYGGVPMTKTGISKLLQRISSFSAVASVHVMVPNSLGPGELLTHYGTENQKNNYLPRLAKGEIPCFGLTSPNAGSDAAGSMTDFGVVYTNDKGEIRIKVTCDKRYITLAPVADIIGLAFKIKDPDFLLKGIVKENKDGEITLALIDRDTEGLIIGNRHDPLGVGFANGTIRGTVDIGIDQIIGEEKGLGEGWKMLMECLAAGRGISLPAGAAGPSKMLSNTVGGYTSIREQFKMPIRNFEGIQEKLSNMALRTLEIDSTVSLMNSILDNNEQPPVLSAILKYRTTECSRTVINEGMDIMGGSAICRGKQNFISPAYAANPVAITVEGSNTLTRSMIVFGQGLNRSHPYIDSIITSIENDDLQEFSKNVSSLIKMNLKNLLIPSIDSELDKFCVFFSLSSNLSLLLGGSLKKMEFLSGRYADILSDIFYGYALEWYVKNKKLDKKILKIAQKELYERIQDNINLLIDNHPHKTAHLLLQKRIIGNSHKHKGISDYDRKFMAEKISKPSDLRNVFSEEIVYGSDNIELINENLHHFINKTLDKEELDKIRNKVIAVDEFSV